MLRHAFVDRRLARKLALQDLTIACALLEPAAWHAVANRSLQRLKLHGCRDSDLILLAELRLGLQHLEILGDCSVTDAGLVALARVGNLDSSLMIRAWAPGCGCGDASVVALAESCPRLTALSFGACVVSDVELCALGRARLRALQRLNVLGNGISDAGLVVLSQSSHALTRRTCTSECPASWRRTWG